MADILTKPLGLNKFKTTDVVITMAASALGSKLQRKLRARIEDVVTASRCSLEITT